MLTDIHHHIIYGVDDGPGTMEAAAEMLEAAGRAGVSRIICTSHALVGQQPFDLPRYRRHLEEEREYIRVHDLSLELAEGCEVLWDESAPRALREGRIPTLNGTNLVLVEFLPDDPFEMIKHAARLLGAEGYRPVFAHVERFRALRKKGCLQELRERYGVIAQMNAATVIRSTKPGLFGDRWPSRMLAGKCIDVVASDAHNTETRPCRMQEVYQTLESQYGRKAADLLCCEMPDKLWNGEH